jgi:hypothetical protein
LKQHKFDEEFNTETEEIYYNSWIKNTATNRHFDIAGILWDYRLASSFL